MKLIISIRSMALAEDLWGGFLIREGEGPKYCLYSFPMKVKTRKAFKRSQGVPRAAKPERPPKGMCVTCLCLVFAYQGPGYDL